VYTLAAHTNHDKLTLKVRSSKKIDGKNKEEYKSIYIMSYNLTFNIKDGGDKKTKDNLVLLF